MSDSLVTLWTVAHQASLSMGFSRKEDWSGLPFPSPGGLSDAGTERTSTSQADSLLLSHQGNPSLLLRKDRLSEVLILPFLLTSFLLCFRNCVLWSQNAGQGGLHGWQPHPAREAAEWENKAMQRFGIWTQSLNFSQFLAPGAPFRVNIC